MPATKAARSVLAATLIAVLCVAAVALARRGGGGAMGVAGYEHRSKGPEGARIILSEFSDFQCPSCSYARPALENLMKRYEGKVRFVFRHFPLNQHGRARDAALVAECSGKQGKFWPMHDQLFDRQAEWANAPDPWPLYEDYAKKAGVDFGKVAECINTGEAAAAIQKDVDEGNAWDVQSTPTLFIGHRRLVGGRQFQDIGPGIIDKLLK